MSATIECHARRHNDMWVANVPQHRVYGWGRTLKALRDDLTHGLSLMGVCADVTITVVSPELARLRRAEADYDTALADAVTVLAAQGSTIRDTAQATGVPIARVEALQAKPRIPLTRSRRKRTP